LSTILKIENLSKHFGKLIAVNELSLEVSEGTVYGILGPNGSGKTTTLGMILEVISPTSGNYHWFDQEPPKESRKKIGSILEMPAFYPYLSAVQNLKITAKIKGKGSDNIGNVLQQVGLYKRKDDAFKTYSLGMKQRLSIASALLADPPVMILDEPTNGLDPQGIVEVRELITKIAARGKTILFASHMLDEVQKVCTHFAVLNSGRKIYDGTVEDVMNQNQKIEVAAKDMEVLKSVMSEFNSMESLEEKDGKVLVRLKEGIGSGELNRFLIDRGIVLTHLAVKKSSLEQKFLKILEESND
jgi:ABC-type multidrug transport system ATPase subunit